MSARVIVNADDFGLSPGVNRGIVAAYRDGIVTSTTLMANQAHVADAVRLAHDHPGLAVGVHLTLLWGRPVAEPSRVPSLLDGDGKLPAGVAPLLRRYLSGRLVHAEVVHELRCQVEKVVAAGLSPTHLDSHKHVHCLPRILEAVVAVARATGISRVRLPREAGTARPATAAGRVRRWLVGTLCRDARARLAQAALRTTDHFVGIGVMGRLDAAAVDAILAGARPGVTELMCHPGYVDDELRAVARAADDRERELAALTDPSLRRRVASGAVELTDYGRL